MYNPQLQLQMQFRMCTKKYIRITFNQIMIATQPIRMN